MYLCHNFKAIMIMTDANFDKNSPRIEQMAKSLLKSMDKDNDSKITREDFVRTVKNNDIVNSLMCPRNINNFFQPSD